MDKIERIYLKTELALLYMPGMKPASARKNLREWMHRNKELMDELNKSGYRKYNRYFTPYQVGLIFKYLGNP